MNKNHIRLRAFKSSPWGDLGIYYWEQCNGKTYTARMSQAVELNELQPNVDQGPLLHISMQSAQELMDSLWDCGLRPSEGTGSAGSLAATQKHLSDMRAIVSKNIGVELK